MRPLYRYLRFISEGAEYMPPACSAILSIKRNQLKIKSFKSQDSQCFGGTVNSNEVIVNSYESKTVKVRSSRIIGMEAFQ